MRGHRHLFPSRRRKYLGNKFCLISEKTKQKTNVFLLKYNMNQCCWFRCQTYKHKPWSWIQLEKGSWIFNTHEVLEAKFAFYLQSKICTQVFLSLICGYISPRSSSNMALIRPICLVIISFISHYNIILKRRLISLVTSACLRSPALWSPLPTS